MKNKKQIMIGMMAVVLGINTLSSTAFAAESVENEILPITQELYTNKTGLNVESRTEEEIRAFMAAHPTDMDQLVEHSIEPSVEEPYSAGVLSDETLQSALNMVNQIRYIAGLDANVTLKSYYSELGAAGSLLNYLNGGLNHFPERPEELSDSKYDTLYNMGYRGCSSSNLASGYKNLNTAIAHGWMADYNRSNIDRVGHRRWVLNPTMGGIGFGATGRSYAMYAFDRTASGGQSYVAWPAQVMPIQYFDTNYPWSVSTGHDVDASSVTVTMTRRSDNTTWTFSADAADGEFYVNNTGYGQTGCIIWRPDNMEDISVGDVFDVQIAEEGYDTVAYTVSFVDISLDGAAPSPYPHTSHPYANNMDEWYTYTMQNASKIAVTFSEKTYVENRWDSLDIYDGQDNFIGSYTKDELAGQTITIPGNTIKIHFQSNGYGTYYGFEITSIVSVKETGLYKEEDGQWHYYENGVLDTTYTGMAKNKYGWWYMTKGKLDTNYTGMAKNDHGWWYMKKGKLDQNYTGLATNEYGTWYMKKGKLDKSANGMVKVSSGWVYLKNGKFDTTYTGMAKNQYGWWYIKNGELDQTYTGMAKNQYGWWYMTKGKLDTNYTGMAKNKYGWWYMTKGKLDTSFEGIAQNEWGKWYMKSGKLQSNYSGTKTFDGVTYTINKGKVVSEK